MGAEQIDHGGGGTGGAGGGEYQPGIWRAEESVALNDFFPLSPSQFSETVSSIVRQASALFKEDWQFCGLFLREGEESLDIDGGKRPLCFTLALVYENPSNRITSIRIPLIGRLPVFPLPNIASVFNKNVQSSGESWDFISIVESVKPEGENLLLSLPKNLPFIVSMALRYNKTGFSGKIQTEVAILLVSFDDERVGLEFERQKLRRDIKCYRRMSLPWVPDSLKEWRSSLKEVNGKIKALRQKTGRLF